MSSDYFSADLHWWHRNIMKYCKRPFKDVHEMNKTLIHRHNKVVGKNDRVYLLGDVCFGSAGKTKGLLEQMNGIKYLVYGNHDGVIRKNPELQEYFEWCKDYAEITIQDKVTKKPQFIILSHYAMRVWNRRHHGSWQLYGHSHGTLPDDPDALQIDVGVDSHDYYPISYEDIKEIMSMKNNIPIDHHKKGGG